MSSILCNCEVGLANLGKPGCVPPGQITANFAMVNPIANDGTENSINSASALNNAFFTALINQTDTSKRLYFTGPVKNVNPNRADPEYFTWDDQSKDFLRQGPKTVTFAIKGGTPEDALAINSNRCTDIALYQISVFGSITGINRYDDGKLYPIKVSKNTMYAKYMDATDKQPSYVMVTFEWDILERDEELKTIQSSSITGINLSVQEGLKNVYGTIVSTGQTDMVIDLFMNYGNFVGNSPIEGLVTADFVSSVTGAAGKIRNVTDSADVTITASESTTIPGRYTLSYTSQTVSDVLQPMIKKNGLDAANTLTDTGTVV